MTVIPPLTWAYVRRWTVSVSSVTLLSRQEPRVKFESLVRDATNRLHDDLLAPKLMVDVPDVDLLTCVAVLLAVVQVCFDFLGMRRIYTVCDTPHEVSIVKLVGVR